MLRLLKLPAYYVPSAQVRLLGTSSLLQTYRGEALTGTDEHLRLSGVAGDTRRGPVTARINPANNLPMPFAYSYQALQVGAKAITTTVSEVSRANENLSEPEKELLCWHYRLGHPNLRRVQFLLRSGVLSCSKGKR